MNKKKGIKLNPIDIGILGVGIVATYFIIQAVTGKIRSSESGTGGSGSDDTGGGGSPAPTFPTIVFPYAGSYNTVPKWVQGWQTFAVASCYTDCSYRYDILEQTQNKLNDAQIRQVSDGLRAATGKNMYQLMDDMTWFGGPYSNNKATALWERVKTMNL
jgi:hypothetical protein